MPNEEFEFPLSPAQARLLVLDRMHPGSTQYHVPAAFAVSGPLDVGAFTAALAIVVDRHEALRTVLRPAGGEYVQVVAAHAPAGPSVHTQAPVPAAEVHRAMLAQAARPFDIERGPLLRCSIHPVTDGSHRVLLTAHHLICDGWSLEIMLRELSRSYAAALCGRPARYDPLPVQYPDYAAWQRKRVAEGGYADAVAYWAELLRGAPAVAALPTRQPRPAIQSTAAGADRFVLPAATRGRLAALARRCRATPFATAFAAFTVFLGRICGQEDLVVGIPVSGRDLPELQGMVGMLTNTLALRVDLRGDPSFSELVARVRDALNTARPHADAPFDSVVNAVVGERALSHDPVVQVAFGYDDDMEMVLDLHGAAVSRVEITLEAAKFDLLMLLERMGPDLSGQVIYRSDLFDHDVIRHWVRGFRVLVDSLLDGPDQPVSAARLVGPADRGRILRDFNHTSTWITDRLVPDLVAERAAERPAAIALADGNTTVSYRELLARADDLADRLRTAGVGPEVPVGVCLPRCADMAIAALGVLRAGGAYIPLDPQQPTARIEYMLSNAGARLVLAAPETVGRVADSGVPVAFPAEGVAARNAGEPGAPVKPGHANTAYILYTSGSTGVPKGVMISHRALTNMATAVGPRFGVAAADRVLQYVSFGFDVAVSDLFCTWVAGAELHIAGEHERLGDVLFARLRDSRISYVLLPPSAAMSLPCPPGALPDLRTLAVGGEACPPELASRWSAPGRRIINAYGPSEATVYATTAELHGGQPVRIGRPVANTRGYVLDRRMEPVPVGVVGELYLAGVGLGRGYVGSPGMTAQRFAADPFGSPGSRLYRTGDLARYEANGELTFLGRTDTQVKIRGFRIELGEIEAVLTTHPDIGQAAAITRDTGTGQAIVAYVAGRAGPPPGTSELRAWLAERLPGYMLPEAIVPLDRLPVSRSGKVDRARLPAPPAARPELDRPYAEPGTPTQRRLASIWENVLRLDKVGVHDNFFDLGGNSVRLLAVQAALGDDVTLVDLFRHPNIAALAAWLDQPGRQEADLGASGRRGRDRRELLSTRAEHMRGRRVTTQKGSTE
jgi:amino acid adenylation domain-containing protein